MGKERETKGKPFGGKSATQMQGKSEFDKKKKKKRPA